MRKADKRDVILKAVEKVFRDRRFDEVTLDEIAAEAHVGKGTIYLYFQDKEDLFLQMVQEGLRGQRAAIETIAVSEADVPGKLRAIAESASRFIQRHHSAFKLMHSPEFANRRPGSREIMAEHHERIDAVLGNVFREGKQSNVLRADLDVDAATCVFRGFILARNLKVLHGGRSLPLAKLVDLFLKGAMA